jgi:Carboxypeptidase regulatory-like domain
MPSVRGLTVAMVFWASHAAAQPPPRDAPIGPPQMPSGTGVITGRIVDAQTGSGLARARVRLNWMGPGGSSRPPVVSDQTGAFAFSGLPAGSFTLMGEKATYMVTRFPEGGETLRSGNRTQSLSDGQVIDDVVIRMYHGGAITGHVVDAYGDPVEYAQIQALKLPKVGRGKPQQRNGASTNDLGEFRLARLDPGKYLLMVMPQRRDMIEQPGAALTAPAPQPLPTYYPAAVSLDDAQPITVERGTTVSNVEIALAEGVSATVSGSVVDATGQPLTRGGSISVRPILRDVNNGFGGSGGGLKGDGTFTLRLTPGEYVLEARNNIGVSGGGPPAPGTEQYGSMRINVAGDMTGVTIQLGPGARVTGRFVFDGSAAPPQPPPSQNGQPIFSSSDGVGCRTGRMQMSPDWTFTTDGLFGACQARFNGGFGSGWSFKAIMYDGKDLTDQTLEFASGQRMKDLVVLFTDKRTELNLHVVDERGAATRDFVALAFSTDKARWGPDNAGFMSGSRYTRTYVVPPARAETVAAGVSRLGMTAPRANAGRAPRDAMTGLPAGEYYVIAVDDLEPESTRDTELLEQLSRGAIRVTLAEGEPADVNLRVIKLARQP